MKTRLDEGGTERCELETPRRATASTCEEKTTGPFAEHGHFWFAYFRKSAGSDKLVRRTVQTAEHATSADGTLAALHSCFSLCFRSAAPAAKPNLGYTSQGRMQRPWTRSRRGSPDTRRDAPSHTPLTRRVARRATRGRQRAEAASPAPIMVRLTV